MKPQPEAKAWQAILLTGGSGCRAGQKKAREMWFLARLYSAQQALDMGLVNTVVPLAELENETVKWYATHCLHDLL